MTVLATRPHLETQSRQHGYSLIELLVAIAVMTVVSGTAMSGILNMTKTSATISNRTEMHAGVRNATELLQQEVGQAGRITLPGTVTLTSAVAVDATTFIVNSVNDIFVGEYLVIDTGGNPTCTSGCEETVMVKTIDAGAKQIGIETDGLISKANTSFYHTHAAGTPVRAGGGFAHGVVPKTGVTNGSTGSVLKIFGDINDDGSMVYVEYKCDTTAGNLYRRSVAYTSATKPAISAEQSLLNNIVVNPDGSPCFTYQERTVSGTKFVVDVAITLTVQTADKDPITGLYQKETKALLNVSPRNVFNVWQLAGLGLGYRVQPTPATVTALMALP